MLTLTMQIFASLKERCSNKLSLNVIVTVNAQKSNICLKPTENDHNILLLEANVFLVISNTPTEKLDSNENTKED